MKAIRKIIPLFIVICIFTWSWESSGQKKEEDKDIEIIINQKIKMTDGIHLSANIYKPEEMKEPLPAIFTFTPYISDEGQKRGPFFARHGYVYVHVDVRGRGNSGGEFYPLEGIEGADGARVVEWIARQPWCNGSVAMRGGSYRGMVQWQILNRFPPSLKTIVPTAAAAPGVDVPMLNNISISYLPQWLAFTAGKTGNVNLFSDYKYWMNKFYKMYSQHLPFAKLAEITHSNQKIFKRYLSHPYIDDFWKAIMIPDETYKKINIPILSITGHFDADQPGALHYFYKHMQLGKPGIKEKHYLVVGPWDHSGTRYPQKELGGLSFGDDSVIDMEQLHLEWYDWILKGKEKPEFLKKRICYYLLNENKWKYKDNLEDISNQTMVWYLSSQNGQANDVFHSGFLKPTPPAANQKPDVFNYDPLKIVSKEKFMNSVLNEAKEGLTDQSKAYEEDKLIYHSAPLERSIEMAGYVKLTIYVQLNVPDTDLTMNMYAISPEGKQIPLSYDFLRIRYRNSLSKPELAVPGKIYRCKLGKSVFIAGKLEKGTRLRLIISCLNSPYFEKNYNSGGLISEETAADARTAIIKLYHDKKYPGLLELPVYEAK